MDDFVILAGPAGPQTKTYDGLETPVTCTITETNHGQTAVATVNASPTVTLPGNDTANDPTTAEPIANTYEPVPGSLVVTRR